MPDAFETFWKAYPKKRDKATARKAWNKLFPPLAFQNGLLEKILASVLAHAATADWQRGRPAGQYIPYPASFINGEMWEDEIAAEPRCEGYTETPESNLMSITHINCGHSMQAHKEETKRKTWRRYCEVAGCGCSVEERFV